MLMGSTGSSSPHLRLIKRGGRAQAGQRELPLQPVDLRAACSGWLDQHVAQAAHTLKEGGGGGGPAAQGCLQHTGGLPPPVQVQTCWRWTPGRGFTMLWRRDEVAGQLCHALHCWCRREFLRLPRPMRDAGTLNGARSGPQAQERGRTVSPCSGTQPRAELPPGRATPLAHCSQSTAGTPRPHKRTGPRQPLSRTPSRAPQ